MHSDTQPASPDQHQHAPEKETKSGKSQKVKVKSVDLPIVTQVPELSEKELSAFRNVEVSYLVLLTFFLTFK